MTLTAHAKPLPTDIDELLVALNASFPDDTIEKSTQFKPRPTDIIISPYAKSGTTWLQQITHGLRTRGSMDFDEIDEVAPWILIAHFMGRDVDANQVAEPRLFKSHRDWDTIQKGGRYICAFRNPLDRAISDYRFMQTMWFDANDIDIATFVREFVLSEIEHSGHWHHTASWWEQRDNPDVLLLCYEDMKADLLGTVHKVATFMGIDLDDELFEIVVRQSTREFMLQHKRQFDFHQMRAKVHDRTGYPMGQVETVTPGSGLQLPPDIVAEMTAAWKDKIEAKYGFRTYDELRAAVGALHI